MKAWRITAPAVFVTFCMILFAVGTASAVDQQSKKFYSFKLGYYGSGTISVGGDHYDFDVDTEAGIIAGFSIDVPTSGRLMPGFTFDLIEIKIPGDNAMSYNFIGTIKGDFRSENRKFAIRPGIGGGVAILPEIGILDNSFHFVFRATNDVVYYFPAGGAFITEFGAVFDIYGNAGEDNTHGGPFLFIRGGFGF